MNDLEKEINSEVVTVTDDTVFRNRQACLWRIAEGVYYTERLSVKLADETEHR